VEGLSLLFVYGEYMDVNMKIIARIHTDFPEKFGIPRQSGLIDELEGVIVFEPEYRNEASLKGLDGFSHIWLIWQFSEAVREGFQPTVRPPRLGGNTKMGVFATRSPFRPNSIGLSAVRLIAIEKKENLGTVLRVGGADLMDGTPIFDIKPYLPFVDCRADAIGGFADEVKDYALKVYFPEKLLEILPQNKRKSVIAVLSNDPRPSYQNDDREYGLSFAGYNITFIVNDGVLTVLAVEKLNNN